MHTLCILREFLRGASRALFVPLVQPVAPWPPADEAAGPVAVPYSRPPWSPRLAHGLTSKTFALWPDLNPRCWPALWKNVWPILVVHLFADCCLFLLHRLCHRLTNEGVLTALAW